MIITIKVKPGSRESRLYVENGVVVAKVRAPAVEGKANKAVIELLSEEWKIPKAYIEIVGGETSKQKKVSIADEYSERVKLI